MSTLEKRIAKSQAKRISNGTLTGSHIIVRQNGTEMLNKTFGFDSVGGKELKSNATYRIASMTKPITAAALLIEQQKGRLNIYDDVSEYLDGYYDLSVECKDGTIKKSDMPLKVYMLVSHISGINTSKIEGTDNPLPLDTRTLKSVAEYACTVPLKFEPGTSQEYNTAAFDIAARIIELTSGVNFADYLKENIFDKLGMVDTTFAPTENQWSRMVSLHGMKDGTAVNIPMPENSVIDGYPVSYCAAGCALISTADDYIKFADMLLNNGKSADGEIVMSEESVGLMRKPVTGDDIMPFSQKWGLGVRVITDNKYILPKGCFGWSGKYGSHFWVDPDNRITAVYMKNSEFDGGAGCLTANEFEKDVMKSLRFGVLR